MTEATVTVHKGDALIVVDVQNDFLPGGALAVPRGDEVIAPLNRAIAVFDKKGLPVFATRDWHPPKHCSFKAQGGTWPPHCVQNTPGAAFAQRLQLPKTTKVVSKASEPTQDAYSGFKSTDLAASLRQAGVTRVFIGGLATDYCVLNTAKDALRDAFFVFVLTDAIRAVNVNREDGPKALKEMDSLGAHLIESKQLA